MSNDQMKSGVGRLLLTQGVLGILVAAGFALTNQNTSMLIPALYGAAVSMINTAFMAWRLRRAMLAADQNQSLGQFHLFIGLFERLLLAGVLIAVGIGFLQLQPVPLLTGFGVAYLAYVIQGAASR